VVDGAVNGVADVTSRRAPCPEPPDGRHQRLLYFIVFGVLGGVLLYWSWAVAS
jgi:hypothetical protein